MIRRVVIAAVAILALAVQARAEEVIGVAKAALEIEVNKGVLLRLDRPATTIFVADPEIGQQRLVIAPGLGLHVDVAVQHREASVFESSQGIDLGEGQIVVEKPLQQLVDDRGELVEIGPGHAGCAGGFFRDPGRDQEQARKMRL